MKQKLFGVLMVPVAVCLLLYIFATETLVEVAGTPVTAQLLVGVSLIAAGTAFWYQLRAAKKRDHNGDYLYFYVWPVAMVFLGGIYVYEGFGFDTAFTEFGKDKLFASFAAVAAIASSLFFLLTKKEEEPDEVQK